jgi:hypothetical protein
MGQKRPLGGQKVLKNGESRLTGETFSANFPTINGAYDRTYNDAEAFVSKLDGNLTQLLASTYLGGNYSDGYSFLSLDSSGNVYITGYTRST